MNWDAISAMSDAFGVIAVVITLGYLALQIRFARLTVTDENRLARSEGVRMHLMAVAKDPSLAKLWLKATRAEAAYKPLCEEWDVNAEEAMRIDFASIYWMWLHWGQFASLKTKEDTTELEHLISEYYSVPPVSDSWQKSPFGRNLLDEKFVRFVDNVIAKKKMAA